VVLKMKSKAREKAAAAGGGKGTASYIAFIPPLCSAWFS
jgi:hypothetical protein